MESSHIELNVFLKIGLNILNKSKKFLIQYVTNFFKCHKIAFHSNFMAFKKLVTSNFVKNCFSF